MPQLKHFQLTSPVAILLSGVIIALAIVVTNAQTQAQGQAQPQVQAPTVQTAVRAPSAADHVLGSLESAKVVLIEYSDLECYYCGQAYPTLKRLVEESKGEVAWVHRHLPLESIHPQARPSALASECIAEQLGNDGFWKFADAMFADQSKMSPSYYKQVAVQLGANPGLFDSCVASDKYGARVDADAAEAIQNGGQGTPWTVLWSSKDQTAVSGALPYPNFAAVIKAFKDRQ